MVSDSPVILISFATRTGSSYCSVSRFLSFIPVAATEGSLKIFMPKMRQVYRLECCGLLTRQLFARSRS